MLNAMFSSKLQLAPSHKLIWVFTWIQFKTSIFFLITPSTWRRILSRSILLFYWWWIISTFVWKYVLLLKDIFRGYRCLGCQLYFFQHFKYIILLSFGVFFYWELSCESNCYSFKGNLSPFCPLWLRLAIRFLWYT